MDILKFAQEGNVRRNPDYNPKTKKGALQPPTITDFNPATSTSDAGRSILGRTLARGIYNLNQYNVDKYTPYDTYVNPYDTEEELNKERAENQGVLEQTGRFVGQAVGSEVVLGTLRGFSDLVDAAGQLIGVTDDDYTNPVSSQLAEWQDAIRKRLEIYRENPNENFDFSDSGWWLGNAVSIASTLSLLIPGTAVAKLGKIAGLGRLARGIGKVAGKPFGRPNTFGKMAEVGSDIIGTAAASRVAENYIEARDTYTQVYDEAKERLASMSESDRETLYNANPKLRGLSDDEIAKYVSGESADDTFKNDMWLMLLDAFQLKGLRNIWKGARNIATNRTLREANEQAAARLVGREIQSPTGIKKYLRVPDKESILNIVREGSEGFEEGWQYIQQQAGIDKGREMLNDAHESRTYTDYLKDPQMWEQSFWGWLGGVAFQGIGSAANKQYAKYISKNKDILTESRKAEIDTRASILDKYINDMAILNEGYNPNSPVINDEGNIVQDADGNNVYEEVNETEKEALKQNATEKLITDLTINAIDKGNYDLLKDFLMSEDIAQYMDKSGAIEQGQSKQFMTNIIAKMNEVSETYETELNKAINNDAKDANIASQIAKENTYNKLASRNEQNIINKYTDEYNKSLNDISDVNTKTRVDELNRAVQLEGVAQELNYLNQQLKVNNDNLKAKNITKFEHDHIARKINKKKQAFIKSVNVADETAFNALYNENRNNTAIQELSNIDKNIATAVIGRSMAERRKTLIDSDVAETNQQIRDRAKYIENEYRTVKDEALKDNIKRLDNAFESNDIDTVLDYLAGNKDVDLNDNIKKELDDIVKNINMFDESSEPITDVISRHARLKARQKGQQPVATVNNKPVEQVPPVAQVKQEAPVEEEQKQDKDDAISPLPTGEPQQAPPEIVRGVEEDSADKEIESVLAQQEAIQEKQFNASSEINAYVLDKFLKNTDEELVNMSYDEQYAVIKNELINEGFDANIIDDILPKELSSVNYIYKSIQEMNADEHASSIDFVISKIVTDEQSDKAEYFRNLIDIYKANNNILSVNGKDYFNIISLMRFAIKESNATFETVNKLYDELRAYLLLGTDENLINISPRDLALDREKLMELVQDQEREDPELDNNIGIYTENKQGEEALATLQVGQELEVRHEPKGISFWSTVNYGGVDIPVKIGFNKKMRKTSDNDGYIFSNEFWSYEVRYTEDGYSSSLDGLFDRLNPENGEISDEAKQFIDLIYKARLNKLTDEDINNLWNNSLSDLVLPLLKNKNKNNEVGTRLLRNIGNIYLYRVSDNLNDNYISYGEFIAKQYNNYKMVDNIDNNIDNTKVTVKYVSRGEAIFDINAEPQSIDKAIVGFNYNDIHLGIVAADGEIRDTVNGTVRVKAGFNNTNLLVIVPNGTNEPFYAKVIPQGFDSTTQLGTAIRNEIINSIKDRQMNNISFEELKNRLMDIFGVKNFVNGVNCIEYNNRIIIAPAGSNIPMLTIFKYKNNSTEEGTGITLNPTMTSGAGLGRTGWGGSLETELTDIIDKLLAGSTYSMSYDIPMNRDKNHYVKHEDNGQLTITFGDTSVTYENYLDYIIKNNTGKIRLGKTKVGNVESNFRPNPKDNSAKQKVRIEYEVLRPVGDEEIARQSSITAIEQRGNQQDVNTESLIKAIAPDFADSASRIILEELVPANIDIVTDSNETDFAVYNTGTGKVTLLKSYFDLARGSQYKAVRTLVHEQLHKRIYDNGIMRSQSFIDEMTTIRDRFIEALNNPDAYPEFAKYIQDNNYDRDNYIAQLRKVVDPASFPNQDYNYMLEEFIVESLTNNVLNESLNNISSTKKVSADIKRLNLWQKVIELIRQLFGFNKIKDNTLLAQELRAFGKKFKDIQSVEEKLVQDNADKQVEESTQSIETIINEQDITAAEASQQADDTMGLDVDISDMFSSIDIAGEDIIVPNMASVRAGLSMAERTEFDSSLAAGDTQIYCK